MTMNKRLEIASRIFAGAFPGLLLSHKDNPEQSQEEIRAHVKLMVRLSLDVADTLIDEEARTQ